MTDGASDDAVGKSISKTLDNIKGLFKAVSYFVIIDGTVNFRALLFYQTIKHKMIPIDLNPGNHKLFADIKNDADKVRAFVDRAKHPLRYCHTESTLQLNNISNEACVDIDEL